MQGKTVLVVDDETEIREGIAEVLKENGFEVITAENPIEADELIIDKKPDLVLLDIMMPLEDGRSYCRRLFEKYEIPIIMISALESDVEELIAHELGAIHYMRKPFSMRILLTKIKNVLRVCAPINQAMTQTMNKGMYRLDRFNFDPIKKVIFNSLDKLTLNPNECKLILLLIGADKESISTPQLTKEIYNREYDFEDRSVSTLVYRLRSKLKKIGGEELIQSEYGGGYVILADVVKEG